MNKKELMVRYNTNLRRYNKALEYFNDDGVDLREKEQHIGEFKRVLYSLEELAMKLGLRPESKEMLDGFKIEGVSENGKVN